MIIVRPRRELAVVFTPMLLYLAFVLIVILRAPGQVSIWLMLSAAFFCAGLFSSVFNGAEVVASAARIELRRRLASARAFFRQELRRATPALRDEWLPYVLAFGLGPHLDRWFRRFGPHGVGVGSGASGSSGIPMPGGGWSGGGGSFGGAGSSASWVAAVGTIAGGVPGAGSGGTGGGFSGGGGGSSGGGGGGGW